MKKTLSLLSLFFILSCNSDDQDNSNPVFVEAVTGWYQLKEAYTSEPLDLNQNGISSANLFDWNHYCGGSLVLDSFYARIWDKRLDEISFDFPYSASTHGVGQNYCIKNKKGFYVIDFDYQNEVISPIQDDYWDEFLETNFQTKVMDINWENQQIFMHLEKEFYQANGEWIETELFLTFDKVYFEDEN